ncbi:hypothetical protein TNCT_180721 [Trichonephila clavata]|uniref:Uncharacterized protein n=1 Tax=Trichonephila clavata TaxID=2740835 RepID=A0A8X6LNB4_TRICU|nr:hypothetical protein TNCT_180721 [Trichonephila clavata]
MTEKSFSSEKTDIDEEIDDINLPGRSRISKVTVVPRITNALHSERCTQRTSFSFISRFIQRTSLHTTNFASHNEVAHFTRSLPIYCILPRRQSLVTEQYA